EPTAPTDAPLHAGPSEGRGHGLFPTINLDPLRQAAVQRHQEGSALSPAITDPTATRNDGARRVQEAIAQFSRLATPRTLVDVVLHDGRTALSRIGVGLRRLGKITT